MPHDSQSRSFVQSGVAAAALHRRRAFSLSELLVTIAIIGVIAAVAIPAVLTISRDISLQQARGDVFAALTAARDRAIKDHSMVALHIFYDGPAYNSDRVSTNPAMRPAYYQGKSLRWGIQLDPGPGTSAGWPQQYGIPHIPTYKMVMRLEVPNPDTAHIHDGVDPSNSPGPGNATQAIEFMWLGDHEPVYLPEGLGVCRPSTGPLYTTYQVDTEIETGNPPVDFYRDFYIVFGDDGKVVTVRVDYDLYYTPSNHLSNRVVSTDRSGAVATWSSTGLCLYDTARFKALGTPAAQEAYVNKGDNVVTIGGYTGLPMTPEVNQ